MMQSTLVLFLKLLGNKFKFMGDPMPYRKKLIEVALPLEAINKESAREKSIRHGHPSTLHLWWARRPLAACRAVLFSSLVDDPSEYMPDEESANAERERLFDLIEDLVLWENINNEEVLDKAKLEIARSVARDLGVDVPVGKAAIHVFLATKAPPVLDPFAGGGSIPLEAQRLGLTAYASDLNPVAVLINKALIEIPPKFAGLPPVHPPEEPGTSGTKGKNTNQAELWKKDWKGAEGLAEDVRYYGQWMRDEAYKRIGHLFPPVKITAEIIAGRPDLKAQGLKPGDELTVIAWLWARTVKCPNPACGAQMPLVKSFTISNKEENQAWVEPIVTRRNNRIDITFLVRTRPGKVPEGTVSRNGAYCISCKTPVPFSYVRNEGRSKRIGATLMSIVVEGKKKRVYLPPDDHHIKVANEVVPEWRPEIEMPHNPFSVRPPLYGFMTYDELFTNRQLSMLNVLSSILGDLYFIVKKDIDIKNLTSAKTEKYIAAIITYLSLAIDKGINIWSSSCSWMGDRGAFRETFARQALPMIWDYAEANIFSNSGGSLSMVLERVVDVINYLPTGNNGFVRQHDAAQPINFLGSAPIVSTDPPYYDNIDYADLSDYFYIWLRRFLSQIHPDLFATVLVPKKSELVATPYRFDGDAKLAKQFFEEGLGQVFLNLRELVNKQYPTTIFYAFKQVEEDQTENIDQNNDFSVRSSTGWETILESLIRNHFLITGTWPMRTESPGRSMAQEKNSLASSIVLVCRQRSVNAPITTRRDLLGILKRELPPALRQLQQGSIAPVDLAQAAIGPGMAVFSRYKQVLEADGSPMHVRTALGLINQALDEFLAEQEGEYDSDTRWALAWYEQYGHETGPFGVAETLSKAKNTSVEGLVHAGFLEARSGKVHLLRRDDLDADWDPAKDKRLTVWEACQYLIRALDKDGEQAAGALLGKLGSMGETARDLAYRLYTVCERKGWAQEALAYNMLVVAWPRLKEVARGKTQPQQGRLL
jgi:putative DNA methylase